MRVLRVEPAYGVAEREDHFSVGEDGFDVSVGGGKAVQVEVARGLLEREAAVVHVRAVRVVCVHDAPCQLSQQHRVGGR